MANTPARGEIWLADLNPVRGHEQASTRPVLIISTDLFNQGPAGLILVVPLTRTDRGIPTHIPINPPEGGVSNRSFLLCEALRSISTNRLGPQAWGAINTTTLQKVEDVLRTLMDL